MLTVAGSGATHGGSMEPVRIARVAVAHPPNRVTQGDAAERIGAETNDRRRVNALARASMIGTRATILPAHEIFQLGDIESRNDIYRQHAPGLATMAATAALDGGAPSGVRCLVTSSCTGYALPGWSVDLVEALCLAPNTARVPLTEAGCAGGVVALARGADVVRSQRQPVLTVAAELCSLAFHPRTDDHSLTANLIFGDGAGAARLEPGAGPGLEIVDSASLLVPASRHALGFDLTARGFSPVIDRELAEILAPRTRVAIEDLLCKNGVPLHDVVAWLLHPGGARILQRIQQCFGLDHAAMCWSWESLHEFGNTSSAAIYDVLRRYMEDETAPRGWGVVAAFGPGVSIELLLVRRSC